MGTAGTVAVTITGTAGGWIGPVLFLLAVTAIGTVVGRRPWLVMVMVVITGVLLSVPDGAVCDAASLWTWTAAALVAATAVVTSARRLRPDGQPSSDTSHCCCHAPNATRRPRRGCRRSA